jgi:prevent-host-death family protein
MLVKNSLDYEPKWQLQDAKARFSELVKRAIHEGPQHVSVRGQPSVVVLSEAAYANLASDKKTLVDHIVDGPLWDPDLVDAINARPHDNGRDIDF